MLTDTHSPLVIPHCPLSLLLLIQAISMLNRSRLSNRNVVPMFGNMITLKPCSWELDRVSWRADTRTVCRTTDKCCQFKPIHLFAASIHKVCIFCDIKFSMNRNGGNTVTLNRNGGNTVTLKTRLMHRHLLLTPLY
jgi:hypothetical protein